MHVYVALEPRTLTLYKQLKSSGHTSAYSWSRASKPAVRQPNPSGHVTEKN